MSKTAAIVLAAGYGTRMKSARPKVLHEVAGQPLVLWSVRSAQTAGAAPVVLVVGNGAEAVRAAVGEGVLYATQAELLGTGHATLQARAMLEGQAEAVVVLYGDMPALRAETVQRLVALHQAKRPALTMLTVRAEDAMGFGRVVRDAHGRPCAVVEEAVATPEILAIKELNCGVYCFDAGFLWRYLPQVTPTPPKNEFYLTDLVALAAQAGLGLEAMTITDVEEVQGINTRVHLARCERILRQRLAEQLMLDGVTLLDPATTYVDAGVVVGRDTVIHPNTHLRGHTVVGEGCTLGPNAIIEDTRLGNGCRVLASVLEGAILEDGANIGPFGHLRQGAHLGRGVHMGNFGEVKNAYLAPGTKMGHFSYIGDAQVGEEVNIGAGTITCNYDGAKKHKTAIGAGAFIGSGVMLVAPVNVGAGARIGAGAVVTRDVPPDTLAYGVPARIAQKLKQSEEEPPHA